MPLESDTANADSQLQVTFYDYQGEDQFKGRLHVRIHVPGDKNLITDRLARDDDKIRFQREWLHYQMGKNDALVVGTPLSKWRSERPEEVTQGQLEELHILKFMTVEQVAMASDTHINRVGMGGVGLRMRARSYLSAKNAQASGAELETAKSEIAALKGMVEQLANALAATHGPKEKAPRPSAKKRVIKRAENKNRWAAMRKKEVADDEHPAPAAGAAGL